MPVSTVSRRTFAVAAAFAAASLALPKSAWTQVVDTRPPTVDTGNPREIGKGVWILPDHRVWLVPNIGIIVGRDAALVVDCGLGPANGERVLEIARRIAGSRRLFLTISHFHPEHGYGANVFRKDATVVYNRSQRDELQQKGARYLDLFRKSQGQSAVEALEGTEIMMPHFTYEGDHAEIDLGGRIVELHNWGLAHTRGDQIVWQAHLMGWCVHGMAGFDRDRAATELRLPHDHVIQAVYAIGRKGDATSLPGPLRARERPSSRMPLSEIAFEGAFRQDS